MQKTNVKMIMDTCLDDGTIKRFRKETEGELNEHTLTFYNGPTKIVVTFGDDIKVLEQNEKEQIEMNFKEDVDTDAIIQYEAYVTSLPITDVHITYDQNYAQITYLLGEEKHNFEISYEVIE